MPHKPFLELLQAVEAGRKCHGLECYDIKEHEIAEAERIDKLIEAHKLEHGEVQSPADPCPNCTDLQRQEIALRETLLSQGVDLPIGIMGG